MSANSNGSVRRLKIFGSRYVMNGSAQSPVVGLERVRVQVGARLDMGANLGLQEAWASSDYSCQESGA